MATDLEHISIQPPLIGDWKFLRPPGHHPFAFDFIQTDPKRNSSHKLNRLKFFIGNISSKEFYCWDKQVFSPIDGEIFRIGNGWLDNEYTNIWKTIQLWYNATYKFRPKLINGRLDIRPNAGNYVMIKSSHGYIVFLAHLRNKSIVVTEGQKVKRGQPIGSVGNSGNSTEPHLHINIFDQMNDPYTAKVLPFIFNDYETLINKDQWLPNTLSIPKVGSFVRFNIKTVN